MYPDQNNNGIWDTEERFEDLNGDGLWTTNLESFVDGILVCEGDLLWDDRNLDEYYNDTMEKFGALDSITIDYNNNGYWDAAEPLIDCRAIGQDYFKDVAYCESLGGQYISQGGFNPELYASFDMPGEVETIYSKDRTIFAGLSHSNGFMITKLSDDGSLMSGPSQFATGYSIRGIHEDNGLLALASGHDGILLYDWNGGTDVSFIGKIETSYANNVKVAGSIIFAATEDGIEVVQIDR